jgi:hypothetical protein
MNERQHIEEIENSSILAILKKNSANQKQAQTIEELKQQLGEDYSNLARHYENFHETLVVEIFSQESLYKSLMTKFALEANLPNLESKLLDALDRLFEKYKHITRAGETAPTSLASIFTSTPIGSCLYEAMRSEHQKILEDQVRIVL